MRPGPRRHHDHAVRQEHRLVDRVRDEDHRQLLLAPQVQQVGVELVARDLVERAEGLVHQQQVGLRRPGRARSTRASACRPTARAAAPARTWPGRPAPARRRRARRPRRAARRPGRAAGARWSARWPRASASATGTRRPCLRPLSSSCATGLRHSSRRPSVGSSRPATIFSSVLLPQPEGPSSVTNSPSAIGQVDRLQGARAVRVGLVRPRGPRPPGRRRGGRRGTRGERFTAGGSRITAAPWRP